MDPVLQSHPTQTHTHQQLTSLKTALADKESAILNLISTHDTLKATLKAQIANLEAEKTNLLASLDEANFITKDKERTLSVCREEIQQLRSLLAESQNKCKQTEESARSATQAKFREDLLLQFEDERNKVGDQLKWKSEQFTHLEEAYAKLQSELREVKRQKEADQLEFLAKIGELELAFDEKTHLAEDLRTRLEICNQVLAREESKRKLLEAELRESRDQYDSLVTDFEAAKLAVESVTEKRDGEIASLRGILADKSLQIKEIEFEKAQIDLENKELRASLKEYREIEIGGVEKSKKFRALEKAHKGCSEKIKKREAEIENLKRDLNDRIVRLHEKEELMKKLQSELLQIRNEEVVMDNLNGDAVTMLRRREEALQGERDMLLCQLKGKNDLLERVKEGVDREKGLVRENDRLICEVREMEWMIKQLNEERARLLEKENARLYCEDEDRRQTMKEVEMCKDRLNTLVKEREMLLCELGEKNNMVERVKECMDREKGLLRENDMLISEVREREVVTKQLKMEIAQLLEKENVRLCFEDEEKKQVMREVQMYKDRLDTLVKEKELLLCEVGQKEDIEQQLRECRDREEALLREKEKFICELGERRGLIEELGGNIAHSREHISRLELEVCSLEEEKRKFVEIRDEMAKKLLEIKFKLDPLEKKCSEVAKEKKSEISGLELNLELLVEELENSISEKEELQLGLQEMATSYFLQKHELEFREGLFCDLEKEMEKIKNNLKIKEERFEDQLEMERLVNEAKRVRFSNNIKSLMREKETLALQMHEINCGIGSLLCADGEIKAIMGGILQHMENEGEHMHEKKSKSFVPLFGTRSPLKENNFC